MLGYPFARLHPRVAAWHQKLSTRPEFAKEVAMAPHVQEAVAKALEHTLRQEGKTLEQVVGL